MKTPFIQSLISVGLFVSCGSSSGEGFGGLTNGLVKKVNGGAVDKLLQSAENVATNAITGAVSSQTKLPALPKSAAGGVDLSQQNATKSGQVQTDMDGDGQPETVTVTETEAASGPSKYASWEKDGKCFVAWQNGDTKWVQFGTCGDTSGAIICHYTDPEGADARCDACNAAGACQSCDPDNLESCSWSSDAGTDGGGASDGTLDGAVDPGTDPVDPGTDGSAGTDGTDWTDPGTDGSAGTDGTDWTDPGTDGSTGTDGTDWTDPGTDGSTGVDGTDGSVGTGTCLSLVICFGGCVDDAACEEACIADASSSAYLDYIGWELCVNEYCGGSSVDCFACSEEESTCVSGG
jgi:hypothetical protein